MIHFKKFFPNVIREPAPYASVFQTKRWNEKKVSSASEVKSLDDRYLPNVVGYFSESVFCYLLMNQRFT